VFKLVLKNLISHPIRSGITAVSVGVALFLICLLTSIVTTLQSGLEAASATRLVVMSSISLFVDIPLSYQERIAKVDGIQNIVKWQWFGGYYQDQKNFFAQFAVDPDRMFEVYPEVKVDEATKQKFLTQRNACIVGSQLAAEFPEWVETGKIPITGALFPHPSGAAWDFELAGVYRSEAANFDNRTLFFRWDLFEETLKGEGEAPGVGVYVMNVEPGADIERMRAEIEGMFENGPATVRCDTESEFTRQFISMLGDIPMFLSWIGAGVLVAILLGAINAMLMAGREQTHDVGILKALGFTDNAAFGLLITQSLILCVFGGVLGIALAAALEAPITLKLGAQFPGFFIKDSTYIAAAVVSLVVGLAAGAIPAWTALRVNCVEALRAKGA
jgi:putative ABC transport system permease protein